MSNARFAPFPARRAIRVSRKVPDRFCDSWSVYAGHQARRSDTIRTKPADDTSPTKAHPTNRKPGLLSRALDRVKSIFRKQSR